MIRPYDGDYGDDEPLDDPPAPELTVDACSDCDSRPDALRLLTIRGERLCWECAHARGLR